jgi:adenosylhomocysteine nucleosidase
MIGIVVALYSEAEKLLDKIDNKTEFFITDKKAFKGYIEGQEVVVAISGIGKVSAALTTQKIIDTYNPTYILNFGTAGGMNKSVEILKYYLVDKCCQFDFDLRELDGVPLGYIQEYKTAYFPTSTKGLGFMPTTALASADRFTNDINDINSINEIGCSLRDMEGGAIAQVCVSNNTPLYMIKGVTDVYGSRTAQEQFYENLKQVSAGFPDVVINAIKTLTK